MQITDADLKSAMGYVRSQKTHIEAGVNKAPRPQIQYPGLVPVDTGAFPWAKTVTYVSSDQFGKARWLNGNSDDVPIAGSTRAQHETSVYTAGIGYAYGYEEVHQAQALGVNLGAEDADAARYAYERMVDVIALSGDVEKGFEGLINTASVTVVNATTGDWGNPATTDAQILKDFNDAVLGAGTATNYIGMSNTVLLSMDTLADLSTRRLGDTGESIIEFLRRNNAYTALSGQALSIVGVRGLETAGAASERRMVAYNRDPSVLKMHIPMAHNFLGVYQDGPLNFVVPGIFRLGGLDIRRPKEVRYIDGV